MRPGDEGRDRRERLGRIEIEIGKQHRVIRDVRADHEQRVAVRRRRCDGLGADGGAAARPVLDDDVLAEPVLQVRATTRASASTGPPARNGTISLMVCAG